MADALLPRVRCAICDKPVDQVTAWNDPANSRQLLAVSCHGATETMELMVHDLCRLGPDGTRQIFEQEGVAFAAPRIEGGGDG